MKVLMFGWEFPPHITGGLGTACYGLTKALSHIGVKIIFVVPKAYGDEDQSFLRISDAGEVAIPQAERIKKEFWQNFQYIEINSTLLPYTNPEEFITHQEDKALSRTDTEERVFSKSFSFSGKYGKDLYQEVARYALIASFIGAKNNFDVIHAHDWLTYPAGVAAKQISRKPLVVHIHATEFDRSGEHINQMVFDIEKAGMEAADKVIAVSNLTRNTVIERYGIDSHKVVTVYNGTEPEKIDKELKIAKGFPEKVVTFLGRVTFQKGPDYFIEVARKVLEVYPDVRFVMAGSGDMLNKMITRVAQLGISTKFHFTGFLHGDEVYELFGMSDVYVMPSVSEPFGISPLEAMMSDVPVVISRQSGVAEILRHAVKVNFWDTDDIADAIYGILNYEGLARMFIRYGKEEVKQLKWENSAIQIKEIYQSLSR